MHLYHIKISFKENTFFSMHKTCTSLYKTKYQNRNEYWTHNPLPLELLAIVGRGKDIFLMCSPSYLKHALVEDCTSKNIWVAPTGLKFFVVVVVFLTTQNCVNEKVAWYVDLGRVGECEVNMET